MFLLHISFSKTAKQTNDADEQLLLAAKAGAARELYEETGVDMMRQLERLQPAPLHRDNGAHAALRNV